MTNLKLAKEFTLAKGFYLKKLKISKLIVDLEKIIHYDEILNI
jgi:hypothetical protein